MTQATLTLRAGSGLRIRVSEIPGYEGLSRIKVEVPDDGGDYQPTEAFDESSLIRPYYFLNDEDVNRVIQDILREYSSYVETNKNCSRRTAQAERPLF